MKPITAVVLGAGSRGSTYSGYAKEYPEELQIVATETGRNTAQSFEGDSDG